ncbi:NRAMP family divalent metal transporter [Flavobacterium gawalongense]|uniref:Divalent metal cation transporter n=1 Tax=Flavobacterium gawalongense TaxID=2594432 RepID=A0A553BS61_9FLAO|nr:divalent metal cation transporter [Flavobacterium gawalongense]TRX03168.1 divalent metal cation transporter [Flavobacterium gawalongense]TRX09830.1 divalent metal cation transporter [Flavobacterium gawalongense]TRX11059.1 divalent metal cation transporter [Flavobacterium gawalongense]TRX11978.1 divalent metal cation transporter [Flavobacterium gawalongense]TRX29824.1 divalent metal cation transporter [Flavobacterium gawalongense]
MVAKKRILTKFMRFWKLLGPGLITGASDDDPSGIATYSQAGAAFGLSTLWTALIAFPLMASIQQMCARIGLVTSQGLTGTLKKNYPRPVLYLMLLFSFPAIIMNIGADIAGMGAVGNLLFPAIEATFFSVVFTIILLVLIVYLPYQKIASTLKYLCVVLLVYLIVPFLYEQDLTEILKATFIPTIQFNKEYIGILVGILGTTISPYLFFWQASMEVEEMKHKKKHLMVNKKIINEMKEDVDFGMSFSGLVMFFIILTTGTVLFKSGIHQIETVEQAAMALKPLAGNSAYLLFAIGVIGTGLLAIPVLSGSLSYIITETFGWEQGLDKKFHEAKAFYIVIAISLILGLSLNYIGISPIKALLYTAILYGLTAPVLIAIILHISNNKNVMGEYTNGRTANILGITAFLIMTTAALTLIYLQVTDN